jgi:hypothetical protein
MTSPTACTTPADKPEPDAAGTPDEVTMDMLCKKYLTHPDSPRAARESDAYDDAEAGVMSSSSDEDEADYARKKRKREAEKATELELAKKEVIAVFEDTACQDKVAALADELALWKRTAKKATRDLYRLKRACSCGRAVNYPFTLR